VSIDNGRVFNEWLRAQLKARKMSQRQLALVSGVDHSTISRLVRGDRTPSLGTAARLARGLRELRDDGDATQYLGLLAASNANPTARVEYALRADDGMSELQVRQVMQYYHAIRSRRLGPRDGSTTAVQATVRSVPVGAPAVPAPVPATRQMGRGRRRQPVLAPRP